MDPNGTSALLLADLDRAIGILEKAGETFWQEWLRRGRDQIASGDRRGVEHLLRAFAGEGTFNGFRLTQSLGFETREQRERADERLWGLRESIWRRCRELQRFRSQYKLLKVDRPKDINVEWTPERLRGRLVEGDYEGLDLLGGCNIPLRDLSFLAGFHQMRILGVETRVKSDLAAFTLAGLYELALITGCKQQVPECELPELRRLVLVERDGIESRKWPALEEFLLGVWRSGGVAFLSGGTRLRDVELQGKRQNVSLEGVETCERLESFRMVDAAVEDLAPLRGLTNLRELRLVSRVNHHGSLDLSDIASPALEKLWLGGAKELRNLGSLADLPSLRELRLMDSPLTDADHAVLDRMADRVKITVVT